MEQNFKEKEVQYRRKIKILQERLRRREKKLSNLSGMIKILKREGKCSESLEKELLRRFSDDVLELFKNQVNNTEKSKTRRRYTEKMKEFAFTIYFYSPKAYRF